MPRPHTSWSCSKCHKRFAGYDALKRAEDCEWKHVIDPAIEKTVEAIAAAFQERFGHAY